VTSSSQTSSRIKKNSNSWGTAIGEDDFEQFLRLSFDGPRQVFFNSFLKPKTLLKVVRWLHLVFSTHA
jgi:hypothetical protein